MPRIRNIEINISKNKDKLILEVDLTQDFGPSTTGKTRIVASSGGPSQIKGTDLRFNLLVMAKNWEDPDEYEEEVTIKRRKKKKKKAKKKERKS